jgi:hypothetical protein
MKLFLWLIVFEFVVEFCLSLLVVNLKSRNVCFLKSLFNTLQLLMRWTCTVVHQEVGLRQFSQHLAMILLLHLLATMPSSQEAMVHLVRPMSLTCSIV